MNPNETQALETVLGDFRQAVLAKMEERGMSKAELARMLGLSRSRVSAIFQADNVTMKTVVRVCVALGIKMVGVTAKGWESPGNRMQRHQAVGRCLEAVETKRSEGGAE